MTKIGIHLGWLAAGLLAGSLAGKGYFIAAAVVACGAGVLLTRAMRWHQRRSYWHFEETVMREIAAEIAAGAKPEDVITHDHVAEVARDLRDTFSTRITFWGG